MDISFHYFAVKTLAREAGFDEDEAQQIATFSQYIDDFNAWVYRRYGNVPEYIVNSDRYDLYLSNPLDPANFNPATTGFMSGSWFSSYMDYFWLLKGSAQKFTVSPFHFIPLDRANFDAGDFRAVPATLQDGSFISDALAAAGAELKERQDDDERRIRLMHIGMLLHTFADTYAHQLFSGYNSPLNAASITRVVNNITGADQTDKYKDWIASFFDWLTSIGFPSVQIGHMNVGHVPDLTHLSFTMSYPLRDGGTGTYTRSNTAEFLRTSRQIVDYLRDCRGQGKIPEVEWEVLSEGLSQCFLVDISDLSKEKEIVGTLAPVWRGVFGYEYGYDHTQIFDGIIGEEREQPPEDGSEGVAVAEDGLFPDMEDAFYRFNCYAEDLLITLYGIKPRDQ
ncbi:MAG: hypothetical protein LBK67_00140 [Coriobacteriales bacterium]|jgi:hypothetical protein|nr:hypothetical protein [Coriobacteriales bacterium]